MSEVNPQVTVGIYVFDGSGRLMLIRSPKWQGMLIPPGGHIEYGETWIDTAIRETKEETNLDVGNVQLITVVNMIESPHFTKKAHLVGLQVRAELTGPADAGQVDEREASEIVWATPAEFLQDKNLEPVTRGVIEEFLLAPAAASSEQQCAEYKAGWQRAQADYQNLQREVAEQKKEWAAWSELRVLEEFIPVYDNFKKAFSHHPENGDDKKWSNWAQGIGYIMKQFGDILKAHQIEEIKTVGEQFDPRLHESVGEEASDAPEHTIIRELEGGYMMKGKVVKVAKVIVAKSS